MIQCVAQKGRGITVWSEYLFSESSHQVTIDTETKVSEIHIYGSVKTIGRGDDTRLEPSIPE